MTTKSQAFRVGRIAALELEGRVDSLVVSTKNSMTKPGIYRQSAVYLLSTPKKLLNDEKFVLKTQIA